MDLTTIYTCLREGYGEYLALSSHWLEFSFDIYSYYLDLHPSSPVNITVGAIGVDR